MGAMPDGPREKFEPRVELQPLPKSEVGFTATNTSGQDARELVALNRALGRLMSGGLTEWEAKLKLHAAVADWLEPKDAATADLDRLLGWR